MKIFKVITRFGDFWIKARNKRDAIKKVSEILRKTYGDEVKVGRAKAYSIDELPKKVIIKSK